VRVRAYRAEDASAWDRLVEAADAGTWLHTRRFLQYHGDRFRDASLVVADDASHDSLWGILPAAVDPDAPTRVISHPGSTYGGIVHAGRLGGARMVEALQAVAAWYRDAGFRTFRYKPVPHIFHQRPAEDDRYALFRLGATRYRADLWAVIDLERPGPLDRNRRVGQVRADAYGITVTAGTEYLPDLWPILETQLETRHGVRPTHRLEDILELVRRFPRHIDCWVARQGGVVLAGTVVFRMWPVFHAQYSAAGAEARRIRALDAVFATAIRRAADDGARYFSFGHSNERDGHVLNEGLHRYKRGWGAGTMVHEFWEVDLTALPAQNPAPSP
jgi:hypothetical protein